MWWFDNFIVRDCFWKRHLNPNYLQLFNITWKQRKLYNGSKKTVKYRITMFSLGILSIYLNIVYTYFLQVTTLQRLLMLVIRSRSSSDVRKRAWLSWFRITGGGWRSISLCPIKFQTCFMKLISGIYLYTGQLIVRVLKYSYHYLSSLWEKQQIF